MTREPRRDPVSAISEAEATGETAQIFADIRETMQLPLITSIWRTIVDVEGGLRAAWGAAKPLFLTGQPEASLQKILDQSSLPAPEPIVPGQLACANVTGDDLAKIRSIVDAYNRSNGMNLLALTGLVVPPSGTPADEPLPRPLSSWPRLPALLEKPGIDEATWTLLQHVNSIGLASPGARAIATLWRHLARWPGLRAVIHAAFAPLHREGTIQRSIQTIHSASQLEGACIANLRSGPVDMPEVAREMIRGYHLDARYIAMLVFRREYLLRFLGQAHWSNPYRPVAPKSRQCSARNKSCFYPSVLSASCRAIKRLGVFVLATIWNVPSLSRTLAVSNTVIFCSRRKRGSLFSLRWTRFFGQLAK